MSLGGILILVEEVLIKRAENKLKKVDMCIVSKEKEQQALLGARMPGKGMKKIDKTSKKSNLMEAFMDISGIGAWYAASSSMDLKGTANRYMIWPDLKKDKNYIYGSTLSIQGYFKEKGSIPHLSSGKSSIKWALNALKKHVLPSKPVVVHLKNKPGENGLSNADLNTWFKFFKTCSSRKDIVFVLIGNEEVDKRMLDLPNVLLARDIGSDLTSDLALIQTAYLFMGMASGPCNMAIFSAVPYIIFKNPGHHEKEMMLELKGKDRFNFASSSQKLLQVSESSKLLMREFDRVGNTANTRAWQKRIKRYQRMVGVK